jgi:transposase-like protein
MSMKRRRFSAAFKAEVALEALKEHKTINEIAAKHTVHPNQVAAWKKQAAQGLAEVFSEGHGRKTTNEEQLVERLYEQIGRQKVELDWLKKKVSPLM